MPEPRSASGSGERRLLDPDSVRAAVAEVAAVEAEHARRFSGALVGSPAVHTAIVPAHVFDADTASRWGGMARRHVEEYFPDFVGFAQALELPGSDSLPPANDRRLAVLAELEQDVLTVPPLQMGTFLASSVYRRLLAKLRDEPVEALAIDFTATADDADEDRQADRVAAEIARAHDQDALPSALGLRTHAPTAEALPRVLRTVERVVGALADHDPGVPPTLGVVLPGVATPAQVAVLARGLAELESALGLDAGQLGLEVVVETPRAILDADGRSPLPAILDAADGRLRVVHLGTRSYAAACDRLAGAAEASARDGALHQVVLAAFAGTGVDLADADVHPVPSPPVRQARGEPPLSERETDRNRAAVADASRRTHVRIRRSLDRGFHRGWDVHASQLPVRYGAVYAFFLEHLREATLALRRTVDHAAYATRLGGGRLDGESGQSWLSFFQRGLACGALSEDEAEATGLTIGEIGMGSLPAVLEARRQRYLEEMGDRDE